ncbi:alpha/beta fold hydrolase [Roseateles sp. DC23W]|uniref:Alpha/beta fold hydrolase n=1 Tax=Pelomonas dachongensis TaxID=3299029 RepID=A0ABW7EJL3_9BURK
MKTTLVLLPGLDGTGLLFQPLLAQLPPSSCPVVVSYPADPDVDYDRLTELAAQALPPQGRVVVLGESFSGPVAMRLAAAQPQRVQALVLCCSFVRNPRPALARLDALLDWLPARAPLKLAAAALLGNHPTEEVRGLLAQALARLPSNVMRARLRMVMRVDASLAVSAVEAPVLYLQAAQDRLVPAAAARDIQRLQPRTVVRSLRGPHGLLQVQPEASASAMTAFLAGLC